MSNNVVDVLKGVVGELKEIARSETIIGEPVSIGDQTVIPVVKISFGFGAGGGQGEAGKTGTGFGGGGGGGAKIEPAAFIIMSKDGIKLLPAGKGKWDTIIDAIPGIAKKISNLTGSLKKSKGGNGGGDSDSVVDDLDELFGSEDGGK
jgi:uncharacterized spore protein YtfJ